MDIIHDTTDTHPRDKQHVQHIDWRGVVFTNT